MSLRKVLQRLGLARKPRPYHPRQFGVAEMALQLDGCFAYLHSFGVAEEEWSDFVQLLLNTVAGPDAFDVLEQLKEYSKLREGEREDVVSGIFVLASAHLQMAWTGGEPDPLVSGGYPAMVAELIRQGKSAGDMARPWPSKQDWPPLCASMAALLEEGRGFVPGVLKSMGL